MPARSSKLLALDALTTAGKAGVHSFDLSRLIGTNYSPRRIHDLKKDGYSITSKAEKRGDAWGVRYFLNYAPKAEKKETYKWVFDNTTNTAYRVVVSEDKGTPYTEQGVLV